MNQIFPKISIITPSLNQGNYLEETILSVLNQNYPNLEYIVIDGGSTDNSVEIIKKYQEKITYWVSEKDNSQSEAINKGFKIATGEIIAWLNSDDYYAPQVLFKVAKAYTDLSLENRRCFWLVGNCQTIGSLNWKFQGANLDKKKLLAFWEDTIGQPSVFWKSTLPEAQILDESLHYAMDLDLWLRLITLKNPIYINETLSFARYYEETKTAKGTYNRYSEIRDVLLKYNGNLWPEKLIINNLKRNLFNDYFNGSVIKITNEVITKTNSQWGISFYSRISFFFKLIRLAFKFLIKG